MHCHAAALAGRSQQAALPLKGVLVSGQSLGGVALGESPADVEATWAMYPAPQMGWEACVGYSALSQRHGSTVTSIYTQAEVVYGFALTAPGRSVCI